MSLSLFQRRHEKARAGVAVMDAASLREKAAVERALEALTLSLTKSPDALGTDALPRDLGGSGPLYANRPPFFSSSN
jgi:hypothetical protein